MLTLSSHCAKNIGILHLVEESEEVIIYSEFPKQLDRKSNIIDEKKYLSKK